jgi:hypothetical protein
MRLPLDLVLRRGVIFLWTRYSRLDDPALEGLTKPKYIVILSGSPHDDPMIYILTTSEKSKHARHPFPQDLQHLAAETYDCFAVDTLIDAGDAGQLQIGRDEFVRLYETDEVIYKGCLSEADINALMDRIVASRRVATRVKQVLGNGARG